MTCKLAACLCSVSFFFFFYLSVHLWFVAVSFLGAVWRLWDPGKEPRHFQGWHPVYSQRQQVQMQYSKFRAEHTHWHMHSPSHLLCSTPLAGLISSMTCLSMLVAEAETRPWKWALHDVSPPSALSSGWVRSFWPCPSASIFALIIVSSNKHLVLPRIIMA